MKILKKAQQKNFIVNDSFYTESQLKGMVSAGIIHILNDEISSTGESVYRLYASECTELKIICVDGFYNVVGITKDGEQIFIIL